MCAFIKYINIVNKRIFEAIEPGLRLHHLFWWKVWTCTSVTFICVFFTYLFKKFHYVVWMFLLLPILLGNRFGLLEIDFILSAWHPIRWWLTNISLKPLNAVFIQLSYFLRISIVRLSSLFLNHAYLYSYLLVIKYFFRYA